MPPLDDLHARQDAARGIEAEPSPDDFQGDQLSGCKGFMFALPLALITWGCILAMWDWFE